MSFVSRNENFIRIKFYSEMRRMSLQERIAYYDKYLKSDTLLRLNQYFKSQKEFLDPQSEISQKKADYKDILKLLKDFEFDIIIKSIFFEENANELFYHLKETIIECVPVNYFDEYNIIDLVKKSPSGQTMINISDSILSIFCTDLEVNISDLNSEIKGQNQIIYKLCDWLDLKLKEQQTEPQIIRLLFYYTKYWNIYFAKSSDDVKRIFLLHKLSELIESKGQDFVVNIHGILQRLERELSKVLCDYSLPPFLVTEEYLSTRKIKITLGYENKLNRFLGALNENNNFFRNYSNITFEDLIKEYFSSQQETQKHLSFQIFKKMDKGEVPSQWELQCFKEFLTMKSTPDNRIQDTQNFISLFSKRNYLFDC